MSRQRLSLTCPNCGHEFAVYADSAVASDGPTPGYCCPVCQYRIAPSSLADLPVVQDIADIQAQLDRLLRAARANGVPPSEIVDLLRDELQFEAELAQAGRKMVVQIIDLGPQEMMSKAPGADPHDTPNMRSAHS